MVNKAPSLLMSLLIVLTCVGCTLTHDQGDKSDSQEAIREGGPQTIVEIDQETDVSEEEKMMEYISNLPPDELVNVFPETDGAYADMVIDRIIKMLIEDISTTISLIAESELHDDQIDMLCLIVGRSLANWELPEETIQIFHVARNGDLTEKESKILDSIFNGYESA